MGSSRERFSIFERSRDRSEATDDVNLPERVCPLLEGFPQEHSVTLFSAPRRCSERLILGFEIVHRLCNHDWHGTMNDGGTYDEKPLPRSRRLAQCERMGDFRKSETGGSHGMSGRNDSKRCKPLLGVA
jgi:hypothetical protein